MLDAFAWIDERHERFAEQLGELVAIPSISPGRPDQEALRGCAERVADMMRHAGLADTRQVDCGDASPYVFGQWMTDESRSVPTILLYSHYDVQPVNQPERWEHTETSAPEARAWKLDRRDERLFGRGASDDKGGFLAQLAAVASLLATAGRLPVNVKMLVEGEEETGSSNLMRLLEEQHALLRSDVIVVCDTDHLSVGVPSITYSLRGALVLEVTVTAGNKPVHSGLAGGAFPEAAWGLIQALGKMFPEQGRFPIPGFHESVRPIPPERREALRRIGNDTDTYRRETGLLPQVALAGETDVPLAERIWHRPWISIPAIQAGSINEASNQVLPEARAMISCRIVPDQEPAEVIEQITRFLREHLPYDLELSVQQQGGHVAPWMTDPSGEAFDAATSALRDGYGVEPVNIGCGGSIGFVRPFSESLGGVPVLLLPVGDPLTNAHSFNESLHEPSWHKLMKSLVLLLERLASLESRP